MREHLDSHDDFEATIRIMTRAEGGRRSPPVNGIRWDFAYSDTQPPEMLYLIWPDFCDESGRSLSTDHPLPVGVELRARMRIVSDEMRTEVHQARITVGTRFFCYEGDKCVAEGIVTRITGLFTSRTNEAAASDTPTE